MPPREVFEPAVKNLPASVVPADNHLSGCLEPSCENLSQAGKLPGRVIIMKEDFMRFKQKGLMWPDGSGGAYELFPAPDSVAGVLFGN